MCPSSMWLEAYYITVCGLVNGRKKWGQVIHRHLDSAHKVWNHKNDHASLCHAKGSMAGKCSWPTLKSCLNIKNFHKYTGKKMANYYLFSALWFKTLEILAPFFYQFPTFYALLWNIWEVLYCEVSASITSSGTSAFFHHNHFPFFC
jgi:hypothetical protein